MLRNPLSGTPDFSGALQPDTLFYVDPPYVDCEHYYGPGLFSPDDLSRLAAVLRDCKGRWLVSINDHPAARDAFAGCKTEVLPVRYTVSAGEGVQTQELLISK